MDTQKKQEFISFMLEAQVLRFGSFITKSGRKSPYFINTGNYRTGAQIARLGSYYAAMVAETCGDDFDALFGPAYKGIPLVTATAASLAVAHGMDKPFFFNRKEAKEHGEGGTIIGHQPQKGERVVIIEDVITAGTAVRETMPILEACGAVARDMFISVNRCEAGRTPGKTAVMEVHETFGIRVHALITAQDIADYLAAGADSAALEAMRDYIRQYGVFE